MRKVTLILALSLALLSGAAQDRQSQQMAAQSRQKAAQRCDSLQLNRIVKVEGALINYVLHELFQRGYFLASFPQEIKGKIGYRTYLANAEGNVVTWFLLPYSDPRESGKFIFVSSSKQMLRQAK